MEGLIDLNELNNEIHINPLGVYNKCNDVCNILWDKLNDEDKYKILIVKIKTLAKLRYYEEGIQCCKEAYILAETNKKLCDIYIVHALIESSIDNDLAACELYFKALTIAKTLDDWKVVRRIYNNICGIYMHYEAYDEAYEYVLKIQELDNKYSEEIIEGVTTLHQFMAKIYANKNEYSKALAEIDKAIVYSKRNCHAVNEAFGIMEKALIFKMANNYEEALRFLDKAQNMLNDLNVYSEHFSILIDEIECYYEMGEMKFAEKLLTELEEYVKQDKFVDYGKYIEVMLKVLPNHIKESNMRIALNNIVKEISKFKKNEREILFSALKGIRDNHELEIKNDFLQKQNKELVIEFNNKLEVNKNIKLILDIGKNIVCLNEEDKILRLLYNKIGLLLNIDVVGIILVKDNSFDRAYFINEKKVVILKDELKKCNTISSIMMDTNLEYFIYNNKTNSFVDVLEDMKCVLFMPITYNGKINGILTIQSKLQNTFNNSLVKYIEELVSFIAVSINNLAMNKGVK